LVGSEYIWDGSQRKYLQGCTTAAAAAAAAAAAGKSSSKEQ
jgi:hypothetical protein